MRPYGLVGSLAMFSLLCALLDAMAQVLDMCSFQWKVQGGFLLNDTLLFTVCLVEKSLDTSFPSQCFSHINM